ncbi:MAG: tetratricopeptide repeat protein, partial [Bacteroidales bacterium]|nr:tetratricopeptide repeat protein [Bacteroidales bacterium]
MNLQNTISNLLTGCLILIASVSPFNFMQGQSVDSLQQIIKSESDDSLRVVAMISYSKLVEQNESESAFIILNDAEALASGQENKMLLVRVYNEKAFLFQKLAKYAESLEQLYKAKRIIDLSPKESYDKDMAVLYLRLMNGIGILNYRMEQNEKAIVCFQEGLNFLLEQDSIFSEDSRHRYLFYFYNNMGGNYLKIEEFPRAQYYLEQGIRLISLENNTREYANVLNNLSIASREMGDLLKASELADESMEICLKNDFKLELASIYNNKGSCCKKNNDLPHAADNFQKAFELSRKNGFGSSGTVALTNLTDTYFSMRQYELSAKYSMLLLQWRDSLRNKEEIRRFAEIET